MNLYEEDKTKEETEKSKKIVKIMAVILGVLLILCIIIAVYISYLQEKQLKVYIDGQKVNVSEDDIIIDGNNIYFSIKGMAERVQYVYNNGEYKQSYIEDKSKCYVDNGTETASYTLGSNTIYKSLKQSEYNQIDYEYYTIDEPVISNNSKLYTTTNGLSIGCNLSISYTEQNNTIKIFTLPYLYNYYSTKIAGAEIEEQSFENKKAVLYNMIIVKNESGKYGVNQLDNETVIGQKYAGITFVEGSQEFVVKTEEGKVGILTKDAEIKIKPEYDTIKQIDKSSGLYLVSNNDKYGIVNEQERKIAYLEYDQIGIDQSKFVNDDIDNPYVLYGECIPVKKGEKWGMINKNGNEILPIQYNELGCQNSTNKDSVTNPVLLIPEYKAFVVGNNKMYGLFDSTGKELIPVAVTDMYSIISSGKKSYYLTYNGNTMDIIDYLLNTLKIKPSVDIEDVYINNENDESQSSGNNTTENVTMQNDVTNNQTATTSASVEANNETTNTNVMQNPTSNNTSVTVEVN